MDNRAVEYHIVDQSQKNMMYQRALPTQEGSMSVHSTVVPTVLYSQYPPLFEQWLALVASQAWSQSQV
jgi:hypothetical protein